MNHSRSTVFDFVNKHSYPILLTLFVLWICVGVFPLVCYETDGQMVTLGCDITFREGWTLPPPYTYEYRMQPLMTIVVVALKHLLPFFTCEQIYSVFTALAGIAFLTGCVEFGRYVTKASRTKLLIAAMLLPEMYAVAMYSNSAIPAAALMIWALLLTGRGLHWQSLALLCIAVWFRIDIVIIYPVILPLLYFGGMTFKRSFCVALAYAVAIVVITLPGFWLMNADALGTYGNFQRWNNIITPILRFYAIYGFYSLTYFLLLPLGIACIASQRRWKELFVVLLPILFLHLVMIKFGNASKHFLYNAPFVIIAGVYALSCIEKFLCRRPLLKWAVVCGVLVFFTVSVRRKQTDTAWLQENPLHNVGIVAPLFDKGDIAVSIGAGPQIITRDEYMLGSGQLFYSWYIHSIKEVMEGWREQQQAVLDTLPTTNILTFEYAASAPSASKFLIKGCHFSKEENMPWRYEYTVYDHQRKLRNWRVYLTEAEHDSRKFASYIDTLISVTPKDEEGYVITAADHFGFARYLDENVKMGKAEKKAEHLYRIIR